jgi:HPt (histidine-containing phosphotransfer) domain-containing protein
LLLDLEGVDGNPFELTWGLRRAGYLGSIVGVTLRAAHRLREWCEQAGLTGYLPKPVTRDALVALVERLRVEPLLSTLRHDVALAPLINEFVASLRARAKRMVVALERGDLTAVWQTVLKLRGDAGSYGFYEITEEAEHVQSLLSLEVPAQRYRAALTDLIHLCLAARPVAAAPDPVGRALLGRCAPSR